MRIKISDALLTQCRKSPERLTWLESLPGAVQELEHRWGVTPDTPLSGEEPTCSYVEAVRRLDGSPAVLKISMPHMEQEHEADGLHFWNGNPTVRLLESDDETGAMLLERCQPGTTLRVLDECEQDIVISDLLRQLWRPTPTLHRFRPLSALVEYWSNETLKELEQWPDRGLVREGLQVFKELPHSATKHVLLATDLHAGNVLRSERRPWLVIDPNRSSEIPPTTGHNICSIAPRDCNRIRLRRSADLRTCSASIMNAFVYGHSPAQPLSRATIGTTVNG